MTDPKRGEGKPLKYDPDVSDKGLQQCMPGRNTRKKAPCGAQDGRVVEIRGVGPGWRTPQDWARERCCRRSSRCLAASSVSPGSLGFRMYHSRGTTILHTCRSSRMPSNFLSAPGYRREASCWRDSARGVEEANLHGIHRRKIEPCRSNKNGYNRLVPPRPYPFTSLFRTYPPDSLELTL